MYNYALSEKLYRIRPKRKASTPLHSEESDPVQAVGIRDITYIWIHNFFNDPNQYA